MQPARTVQGLLAVRQLLTCQSAAGNAPAAWEALASSTSLLHGLEHDNQRASSIPSTSGRTLPDQPFVCSTRQPHVLQQYGFRSLPLVRHFAAGTASTSANSTAALPRVASAPWPLDGTALPQAVQQQHEYYELVVTIQAFEPRFLNAAANTIRDLLFITFAPKSLNALTPLHSVTVDGAGQSPSNATYRRRRAGFSGRTLTAADGSVSTRITPRMHRMYAPVEPVNLFVPIKRRGHYVNWKRSRFTVIRGPFIDKKGMEQFERREYKVSVKAATNSSLELEWALEALKVYEFPGVQLTMDITSSAYITPRMPVPAPEPAVGEAPGPGSAAQGQGPQLPPGSLLAGHLQRVAPDLVLPQGIGEAASENLQTLLRELRTVIQTGVERKRRLLAGKQGYADWLSKHKDPSAVPPASLEPASSSGSTSSTPALPPVSSSGSASASGALPVASMNGAELRQALLQQRLEHVGLLLSGSGSSGSSSGSSGQAQGGEGSGTEAGSEVSPQQQALAFLAAADAVLLELGAKLGAIGGTTSSSSSAGGSSGGAGIGPGAARFATHPLGPDHPVPAAQWMHAVLKAGQYADKLAEVVREGGASQGVSAATAPFTSSAPDDPKALLAAYSSYGLFSYILLYRMLAMWYSHRTAQDKARMAVPEHELYEDFMGLKKRSQGDTSNPAGSKTPATAAASSSA